MEYISCDWIESRMVLEMKALKFCCIGHSGHKGYVPICDYSGGPLPIETILAERKRLTALNNDPKADSGCKGCHFLKRKDWQAERKSTALFDQIYVSNFSICNLACRYCFVYQREYTEVSNVAGYPLLPVFEELIQNGYLAEGAYIEWGGGEPTIVKGFSEIMHHLLEKGYSQQVHTSSVKFSKDVEEGLRLGTVRAVTSVDSGTRETYKEVKGRDRFDVVWESIGKYSATGGNMTVKYILRKNNSDDQNIHGLFQKCKENGVRKLVLTPDFREIAQKQVTEETIAAFARMVHHAQENEIAVEIRDEYLNPAQMKMVTRYIPWAEKEPLYQRFLAEQAKQKLADAEAQAAQRRLDEPRTRAAIGQVRTLIDGAQRIEHPMQLFSQRELDKAQLFDLLAYQTSNPDPELKAQLTSLLASRSLPSQLRLDKAMALGVSADGWTQNGEPGYVMIDATRASEPIAMDMWFTCWAKDAYPLDLEISDGEAEDIRFTFHEPLQLRVSMPLVPAGQSRIFAVKTNKTWVPSGNGDTRRLGIGISTSIV